MELQRLEFYVSRMRNLVICYFNFKNQSHYSGVCDQRVKAMLQIYIMGKKISQGWMCVQYAQSETRC